jgi:hypothetical protein
MSVYYDEAKNHTTANSAMLIGQAKCSGQPKGDSTGRRKRPNTSESSSEATTNNQT